MSIASLSTCSASEDQVPGPPGWPLLTPALSTWGMALQAGGPLFLLFFFPRILRTGRSSYSQEGFDFWKEPNIT